MATARHGRDRGAGRALALLAAAGLASSCAARPARPGPGEAAAGPSVRAVVREPTDPSHRAIEADLRERRVLERLAEVLGVVRLPRPLTLSVAPCGTSNAWYDPEDGTVTFCYEYLADIRRTAAASDLGAVPIQDAVDGPMAFVVLHETGHAVFDLLKVPVLGKEEDAADAFAAVVLLRLGKDVALHMLRGAAWAYAQEARARKPGESDFADVHGLDAQRYYNILCLAYGSDPEAFGAARTAGRLPDDRAEGCEDEYRQALYAIQRLVAPSIDVQAVERLRAKHGRRWEAGR